MQKLLRINSLATGATLLALIGWLVAPLLHAQSPKGYAIGDPVADFRLKTTDDRSIGLGDYRSQKGLILVFTSNHCPFSKAYEDRVLALDRRFASQGYPVLAIMPNDPAAYEDDSFDRMKTRARDKGYTFAYAIDETQAVAHAFGATRTPQIFVLKQTNGQFTLQYMGTIDDSPQDAGSVQRRYVEEAVGNLLAGRPVQTPVTRPIGCMIKWKGL
ncbi:thioredoxin family protein [Fibrisoma montanum]|uniref:Thioredoxin family protein n=1 Tax=Fibrisoma montanum TaxID=2305895 RepID=A0A418MJ28_9BACT|nr:thioredoxin family protein [Fibrisoma montanum]RIV27422.1 thioredoxin family protein [Fibrisoma montanum]